MRDLLFPRSNEGTVRQNVSIVEKAVSIAVDVTILWSMTVYSCQLDESAKTLEESTMITVNRWH